MEIQIVNPDTYNIISSGSHGNCEIAFKSIMIDVGVPFLSIKPFIKDLQLVLLSHIHKDHFNTTTIHKLAYERPTLRFGCGSWMVPYLTGIRNVDVYEFGQWYNYGDFKIAIGKCYHDVENCFFRIEKNGYKIFRATDTFTLEGVTAQGYDLFCLEHNYDEERVQEIIIKLESEGKFAHQRGAINSHLSEQQAREFIFKNKGEHSKVLRLHETKTFL